MIHDVMVFTPVYRLRDETVAAVMALEWDGPLTFVLQRDNPHTAETEHATGVMNHLHQYQRGREMFLRGDYDALLTIEDDMIPPPDTLKRLAALDVDLAFGTYMFRHGVKVANVLRRYYPWQAERLMARNPGESISLSGLWEDSQRQGVIECSGSGFGCTLIKRHVIEDNPFAAHPNGDGCYFDWPWTEGCYGKNYTMKADARLHVGHIDGDGETVLWPGKLF
jgi:hypothetical protein